MTQPTPFPPSDQFGTPAALSVSAPHPNYYGPEQPVSQMSAPSTGYYPSQHTWAQQPAYQQGFPQSGPMQQPAYAAGPAQHYHQNVVIMNSQGKSVGVAFLLTFLFGALGVFYSSVIGGIVMSIAWFFTLLLGLVTFGLGWGLFAVVWMVSILWGCIAASNSNSKAPVGIYQGGPGY